MFFRQGAILFCSKIVSVWEGSRERVEAVGGLCTKSGSEAGVARSGPWCGVAGEHQPEGLLLDGWEYSLQIR